MVNGARKLRELRTAADKAAKAVREEEDRQRHAYNDALEALYEETLQTVSRAGWVVGESTRKHVRMIKARPGWASKDVMVLTFAHAEEFAPDLYEDLTGNCVELTEMATGHTCRFNHPPHPRMWGALVETYMGLASPPDQ